MVETEPQLISRFGIQLAAKTISQPTTRSRFQPVVRKPGDGASIWCGITDEAHEAQDSTLYDTFKTGANKRPGSLILVISTAGVASLENPCLALQRKAEQILEGTITDDRLFAAIHCADPDVDWSSPLAVEMANPLLGVSNDREAILLDQAEAVRTPAKQNIFKAKHLNLWSSASAAWMNMSAWAKCYDPTFTADIVQHLPCWIGSDLASKLDLSCCYSPLP
jgi:phage terminase large subunit-like protein